MRERGCSTWNDSSLDFGDGDLLDSTSPKLFALWAIFLKIAFFRESEGSFGNCLRGASYILNMALAFRVVISATSSSLMPFSSAILLHICSKYRGSFRVPRYGDGVK